MRIVPPESNDIAPLDPPATSGKMFEVIVPKGVKPGEKFAIVVHGEPVIVNCPKNAGSGQRIVFNLDLELCPKFNNVN